MPRNRGSTSRSRASNVQNNSNQHGLNITNELRRSARTSRSPAVCNTTVSNNSRDSVLNTQNHQHHQEAQQIIKNQDT